MPILHSVHRVNVGCDKSDGWLCLCIKYWYESAVWHCLTLHHITWPQTKHNHWSITTSESDILLFSINFYHETIRDGTWLKLKQKMVSKKMFISFILRSASIFILMLLFCKWHSYLCAEKILNIVVLRTVLSVTVIVNVIANYCG